MRNANENQVGGTHYATSGVQHWDYVQQALGGAYLMGNITKYVARHRRKNGLQDLEKALHYLQKVMELYQYGNLKPARLPGYAGDMPSIVKSFINDSQLSYWEARVMVLACMWSNLNELTEMRAMIHNMVKAVEVQKRMDEHNAAAPSGGYVDQDRGANAINNQTSKRLDVPCLRCIATSMAVVAAHANPEKYVTENFVPHDWVVDAVVRALQSNLNGS